ncbi:hypothetical protein [Neogemmobacter tilapiae]|uniref:DUF2157 domain-containing protein n=1 Tax=Neogemmobacter tilapiae TaxID=875041 RepID=A0A918TQ32_9RHOB|nr:hypothetical protein [Gemmobacter tilapiae]GHC51823.1 hypothetical protein GCM10007315_12820 [Gemmobacter tilapiae]
MQITDEDIRSAVAAGILNEAQAASLTALAAARHGQRDALPADEEPFEFFRGFAEIFVSVGLILLISGILAFTSVAGSVLMPAITAALCWTFARYFTLKRRMALPSIVLTLGFALGAAAAIGFGMGLVRDGWQTERLFLIGYFLVVLAVLGFWYRSYKVPFSFVPIGLAGMGLIFVLTDSVAPLQTGIASWSEMFDLRTGSGFALGTLIFGLCAFAGGVAFDMRDPYRLGRSSASGFWLHILAAPALVNTVALTALNSGDMTGKLLLAVVLALVALLALIIDRRSFMTAAVVYLAILVGWLLRAGGETAPMAAVLLVLGIILTLMGTFWTQMRGAVMRALPNFPGKSRLPPYVTVE